MKECTYGWYPPARDIVGSYPRKEPSNSYTKECLFKHSGSRYADKSGVPTPEDPLTKFRWQVSSSQARRPKPVRRSVSPRRHSRVESQNAMISLEIRGHSQTKSPPPSPDVGQDTTQVSKPADPSSRPQSVGSSFKVFVPTMSYSKPNTPQVRDSGSRPTRAWSATPKEDPCKELVEARKYLKEASKSRFTPQPPTTPLYGQCSGTVGTTEAAVVPQAWSAKKERIRSAQTYRPRVDIPRRSVMSAGSSRPAVTPEVTAKEPTPEPKQAEDHIREFERARDEESVHSERDIEDLLEPELYYPSHVEVQTLDDKTDSEPLGVDLPKDYDQELERYGWRMQVHGDPLNLKRPCISKRQAFTVKLPKPQIAPDPPGVWKENLETFFLNTIPRKPLSYTIHEEWASEVLHAKRMELQKRDGDNYRYRKTDYAFIY